MSFDNPRLKTLNIPVLLSYGHPMRKRVIGACDAKMSKIDIMMWLVVARVFVNVLSDLVRVILG